MFNAGTMVTGLAIIIVLLLIVVSLEKYTKRFKIVEKIKDKIMWSSVFRSQIQFYFITSMNIFTTLKTDIDPTDFKTFPVFVGKFALLIALPIFSYFFLSLKKS